MYFSGVSEKYYSRMRLQYGSFSVLLDKYCNLIEWLPGKIIVILTFIWQLLFILVKISIIKIQLWVFSSFYFAYGILKREKIIAYDNIFIEMITL